MAPKLYILHGSPPCRAVMITAKALGITLNIHEICYNEGELYSPEYLKINPQHKVPALDDDGKIICDSHAINAYLVSKYGKDDSLYPKDLYKRALVDEKLYFDASVLSSHLNTMLGQLMNKEIKSVPEQRAKYVKESYGVLEKFLEGHQWVTGDSVTIADFSLITDITGLEAMVEIDPKTFPNVKAWIKRVQALPWLASDDKALQDYITWYKSLLS